MAEFMKGVSSITIAPDDLADEYDAEIAEILEKVFGVTRFLVTDESMMSDFGSKRDWRRKVVQAFDLPVPAMNALVVDLAKELRDKRRNH